MALTPQREAFAQLVASGKSQAEAYRQAYPRSQGWKDDSVWNKASALMRNAQVLARVAELRDELAKRGLWAREDSVRALIGVVNSPEKPADIVAAVRELNKMHGFEAPQKVEHSGSITRVTRRVVDPTEGGEADD